MIWKTHKGTVLLTAVVTLLPIVAGLLLWQQLPDTVPTHFNFHNQPDGWSSKPFAVFGLPLICLGIELLCVLCTAFDPKQRNISGKMFRLVLWICPCVSLLCAGMTYSAALGKSFDIGKVICIFLGILFMAIGNYMPKCQPNYTVGLRIAWTLNDPDNWRYTHRLAGKIWVAGGLLVILAALFGKPWLLFIVVAVMVLLPILFSFFYYRKHPNREAEQ